MFELGQYAGAILTSYAVALAGVFAITVLSIRAQKRVKARIRVIEKRRQGKL